MLFRAARFAIVATFLPVSFSATVAAPVAAPAQHLLALSKTDHKLAVIDPLTLKVLARVPVGPDPHEVVATPDGRTAYVSNTGSGRFHEIDVIDLDTNTPRNPIDTGSLIGPHGLAFVGGKLWFTAQGAKAVGRYDPQTGKIDWSMGTGQDQTHMLVVTPDQKRIYATNVQSGTVSVLDNVELPPTITPMGYALPTAKPYMDWEETIIPFAKGNEGFAVSPDGKQLWTATPFGGTVAIIDTSTKKLVQKIDAHVDGANRMAFTPNGSRLLISSLKTGDLTVFDVAKRKVLGRVNLGHGAAGLVISPDGTKAYVSCTPDAYIAVVDLTKLIVAGHIDIGGRPDGITWAIDK